MGDGFCSGRLLPESMLPRSNSVRRFARHRCDSVICQ